MKRLGKILFGMVAAVMLLALAHHAQATTIAPGQVINFSGTATAPGYGTGPVYNTDINQQTVLFGQFAVDLTATTELYGHIQSNVTDAFINIGLTFFDSTGTSEICCYGWSNNDGNANPGVLGAGSYVVKIWGILASGQTSVGYKGFVAAFETSPSVTPTPIPAAGVMFMTALAGLGFLAHRRKTATHERP